ncbi:MAG: hypothetical protein AAF363_14450 [Bacteroidota bacterium]
MKNRKFDLERRFRYVRLSMTSNRFYEILWKKYGISRSTFLKDRSYLIGEDAPTTFDRLKAYAELFGCEVMDLVNETSPNPSLEEGNVVLRNEGDKKEKKVS